MPERQESALVTGALRGIGAGIVCPVAKDEGSVEVNYRSGREEAERVVSEIERDGGRGVAPGADVAAPDAADHLFAEFGSHFDSTVLVLVNYAGTTRDDLTPSLADDQWSAVIDTNLTAAFRLTRRALKSIRRARNDRIVSIPSVVGVRANPGQVAYAAAKAWLIAHTDHRSGHGSRGADRKRRRAGLGRGQDHGAPPPICSRPFGSESRKTRGGRGVRGVLVSDDAGYLAAAVASVDGGPCCVMQQNQTY